MLDLLLGCGLGLMSVLMPGGSLVGLTLSSYLGPWGVLGCFTFSFVLGSVREVMAPQTIGDPELLSVAQPIAMSVNELVVRKVAFFTAGLVIALGLSFVQLPSMPAPVSWVVLVLVIVFTFRAKVIEGCVALVVVGLLIKLLAGAGFNSAPLAVILCFGLVRVRVREEVQTSHVELNLIPQVISGAVSALIPGLNSTALLGLFGCKGYADAILSDALSEGVSLGIWTMLRQTSKSGLTTALTISTRGSVIEGVSLIALVLVLMAILLNVKVLWEWVAAAPKDMLLMRMTVVGGAGLALSDNIYGAAGPIVGLAVGVCLYIVAIFYGKLVESGHLPSELRSVLATAPILLG